MSDRRPIIRQADTYDKRVFRDSCGAAAPAPRGPAPSAISLLPVTIAAEEQAPVASTSLAAPSDAGQIEITLAGGTVRIQSTVDTTMLQLVLPSLR